MPICPEYPPLSTEAEKRRIVNEWAAEMNAWRHRQFLAVGVEWVQWLGGIEHECPACKAADGAVMQTQELDLEAHLKACTCEDGCACMVIAIPGPEEAE